MKIPKITTHCFQLLLLLAGFAIQPVFAGNFLWTGSGTDMTWTNTANWSPPGSPGAVDTAIFGTAATTGASNTVNNIVTTNTTVTALTYTNSTTGNWQVTQIPSGVTLAATNTTIGGLSVGTGSPVTSAAANGGGTLVVNGNLMVGNNDTGSTAGSSGTLDLSGLSNFVYTASTGMIALSTGARSSGNMNLAGVSNQITVATINDNTAQSSSSATGNIQLGSGTNIINVGTFNVGAGRGSSTILFPGATGGLRLRGVGGTDTNLANMTVGNRNNGGGSGNSINDTLLLYGHPVDVKLGTLTMGFSGSNPTGTANGNGTLSFDTGTVYASNTVLAVTVGGSTVGVQASGTINVGASAGTFIVGPGGMSMVNQTNTSGPAVGSLNVTNGTVICSNSIFKTSTLGTANIVLNGGTLILTAAANIVGSSAKPIDNVIMSSATLDLCVDGNLATANINATTASASGTTMNITSIANVVFPKTIHLITYNSSNGDPYAGLTLTPLTGGYTGTLVDNPGSVDVTITPPSSIASLTWVGAMGSALNSTWDKGTTANWLNGSTPSTYSDPDPVNFGDTASNFTVNVSTAVGPGLVTVTNLLNNYTFTGSGSITGAVEVIKAGTGTLRLAESGGDAIGGGIAVYGGTLILDDANSTNSGGLVIASGATAQIGNNDANGALPAGTLDDEGSLIFDQTTNILVAGNIPGGGALVQNGTGILSLSASNTYSGNTTVNAGTLALTNGGSIMNSPQVTATGATLDLSGVAGQVALTSVNLNNATLDVSAGYQQTNLTVTSLTMGGSGNVINVRVLPPIVQYPLTIALLQSASVISGFNFTLGSLPGTSHGSIGISSDQTTVLLTLTSGPIGTRPYVEWTGADTVSAVNFNWSDATNWLTLGSPGANETVVFNDTDLQGGSALSTAGGGAGAISGGFNNVVDTSTVVGSLIYTNVGGAQNTWISNGVALTVTNNLTNTIFSAGSSSADFGTAAAETVVIAGTNGTLNVNNTNDTFFVGFESAAGSGAQATLDMSALGTFNATVNTFAVGALSTTAVIPSGITYLAVTNHITAVGSSPNEGGQSESLSLMVGETGKNAASESFLYLGQVNVINATSIGIALAKQIAEMQFNPIFTGSNSVVFRGGDGVSPVSLWAIGDGLAQTGGSTSPTGTADFTGGTVDALVSTMYIGRSPNVSGGHTATGTLTFDAGVFSVGNLFAGYQPFNDTDSGSGTVIVNGGTMAVGILNLGFTTGGTGAAGTTGTLNINGGTVAAGSIVCGSAGGANSISMTGGTLIVTNTAGTPAAPLTTLGLSGSTLQLTINGGGTTTNIVATTVSTSGTTTVNVEAVINVTGTQQVPIISYTGTDPYSGLTMGTVPPGYTGASLVDDVANSTIDLTLTQSVNTNPTNVVASFSGNTLHLSWPADHIGWRLLAQTNSLANGLNPSPSTWVAVPGSASVNSETITIDPTKPTVFYRLVYP